MRIDQMRQIVEVCATGSINKASQKLFISQSSLSASIRAAEEELGQKILDRSHKGITLTPFGAAFIDTAQQMLELYDDVLTKAACQESGKLHISSQYLRYASSIFASMHAELEGRVSSFRFTEKTRGGVFQDLMNRTSEIGLIVTPTDFHDRLTEVAALSGLDCYHVHTDECRCMVGRGNPLYGRPEESITAAQLAPFPMIRYERDGGVWEKVAPQESDDVYPHNGTLVISDSGSFQNILARTNGYFIGICNEQAYGSTEFYRDIRALRILDQPFSFDTTWLRLRGKPLTALAKEFLRRVYTAVGERPEEILL